MFDLQSQQRSKKFASVNKSNTTVALPGIRKTNNKSNFIPSHSGYLNSISYEVDY